MALALESQPSQTVVGITVNRGGLDFSERERALLNALRPHLRWAYRTSAMLAGLGDTLAQSGRGAILLSRSGDVQAITEQAQRWLAAYCGRAGGSPALPEAVRAWLADQRAFRRMTDDAPAVFALLTLTGPHGRLLLRFVPGGALHGQDLVLLEEQPAERAALGALTEREREVLACLARGLTDGEIAAALAVSPRTVQAHLRAVYRKLGVSNRTAAARAGLRTER